MISPTSKPVDTTRFSGYIHSAYKPPLVVDFARFIAERYITPTDIVHFIGTLKNFYTSYGPDSCWCLRSVKNPEAMRGFSLSQNDRPRFKGVDARELMLAVIDQYPSESKPIIVRYGRCKSTYCANPNHYFYGTRQDAMVEHNVRRGSRVDANMVQKLREECGRAKRSYASLAKEYKLPYHVVRRICNNESFAG